MACYQFKQSPCCWELWTLQRIVLPSGIGDWGPGRRGESSGWWRLPQSDSVLFLSPWFWDRAVWFPFGAGSWLPLDHQLWRVHQWHQEMSTSGTRSFFLYWLCSKMDKGKVEYAPSRIACVCPCEKPHIAAGQGHYTPCLTLVSQAWAAKVADILVQSLGAMLQLCQPSAK